MIDDNDPPTGLELSDNTIDENSVGETTIGTFTTTDPDASDTWTYSLVGGTGDGGNNYFEFAGDELRTKSDTVLDYETQSSYSIRVLTEDSGGEEFEDVFTINVDDLNEAPTDLMLSSSSVFENQSINTVVGILSTADQDLTGGHTYSLIETGTYSDNTSFNINSNNLRTVE